MKLAKQFPLLTSFNLEDSTDAPIAWLQQAKSGKKRQVEDLEEEQKKKRLKIAESLVNAARAGDVSKMRELLETGADIQETVVGNTALHYAVFYSHINAVQFLVEEAGANINAQNLSGQTPLNWAVERNNMELTSLLLEYGADPDIVDKTGATAMHKAAGSGNFEIIKLLVEKGTAINVVTKDTLQTALSEASANGKTEVVKFLLENGADHSLKNNQGKTSLQRAAAKNHVETVAVLLAGGSKIDDVDTSGRSALLWAAFSGHEALVALLLQKGADPTLKDKMNITAATLAERKNFLKIAVMLKRAIKLFTTKTTL